MNRLKKYAESIASIEMVYLDDNRLVEIPEAIAKLPSLKELRVSGNNISSFSPSLRHARKLRILDLARNQIVSVVNIPAQLGGLRILDLSENETSHIDQSLRFTPARCWRWRWVSLRAIR